MKLSFKKSNIIAGSIISGLLVIFLTVFSGEFFAKNISYGPLLFVLCIVCSFFAGFIIAADSSISDKLKRIISTVLMFLIPILSMTMVECLNNVFIYDYYYVNFINSYILYLLFYGLVYGLCGSYKLTVIILNPILFVFALTNYYVYKFKGSPFVPMDLLSIDTAKEVAASYDYSVTYIIAIAVVLLISIICIAVKLKTPKMHISTKIISRCACIIAMVTVCIIFYFTNIFANCNIEPDFWNQTRGYHRSGFLLNFCLNTKYIYLNEPSNYDSDKTEELVNELTNNDTVTTTSYDTVEEYNTDDATDVICIMNESFSDLSVCGDFTTNKDYMPYYRTLKKNTIKGNLYVPVHGSGTSNTEYEFLTGNTTMFYPAGSNAYTLYVNKKTSSLVSTFGAAGYSLNAFHPYYASGWNRKNVYNFFGFKNYLSITSVIKPAVLLEYINGGNNDEKLIELCNREYPGEHILERAYVSDECDYNKIISLYEERDTSMPYFMFNVTMQNHGSYTKTYSNFKSDIKITSTKGTYPQAEQYLSLVKKSDDAIKVLIDYFSNIDRKVVICMFGDHQPSIEDEFYEEIMGVKHLSDLSDEKQQKRYITPFFIWANYNIEEKEISKLSANYLSSYVLKIAGVKQTKYNDYLMRLSEKLPVLTSTGCIDSDGVYYKNIKKSKYSKLINNYNCIQYNNAIDGSNEKSELFYN